jgi:hypothetical protein
VESKNAFYKVWAPQTNKVCGLGSLIGKKIRNICGYYMNLVKDELYQMLEVPKPPLNASLEHQKSWILKKSKDMNVGNLTNFDFISLHMM